MSLVGVEGPGEEGGRRKEKRGNHNDMGPEGPEASVLRVTTLTGRRSRVEMNRFRERTGSSDYGGGTSGGVRSVHL